MGTITYLFVGNLVFGFIIATALLFNILLSAIGGFFVPITLKKLNIDPAIASSVFVTTLTDIGGFSCFLGLATAFMKHLA